MSDDDFPALAADAPCPCGSGTAFEPCCSRWLGGDERPPAAETLMRARYTAHVVGAMDFIVATHHPATRGEIDVDATRRWAAGSDWLGLEVRDVEAGGPDDDTGQVEFVARYRDAERRRHAHHERALFEKYHGQWYFRDAQVPEIGQFTREAPKQGRNDPCACGSGRKFKKCCGQAA